MSTQRGNVKRSRPQKHQNKTAFKNNLNETNKRQLKVNSLDVCYVCEECKNVIQWKIQYKKYKPLTQPKNCLNCNTKSIKFAYHTLCGPCGDLLKKCCKCRQMKEIIKPKDTRTKEQILTEMRGELSILSERKRRAFYRYLDAKFDKKKRKKPVENEEEGESNEKSDDPTVEEYDDYVENARKKLEELGKGLMMNNDFDEFYSDSGEEN